MATSTISKEVSAAIRALTNWSEAEASDNARDLQAGVTRYTAVHAAIMPLYHAEEQASKDAGNKSYKLETFLGFLKASFEGQGIDFNFNLPQIRDILAFEAHDESTIATFALWVKEDAKERKARTNKDVKVKPANWENYLKFLKDQSVTIKDGDKSKVVDKWTGTGKESKHAKAARLAREAAAEAAKRRKLVNTSIEKLIDDKLEGESKYLEAMKYLQTIRASVQVLEDDALAVDDEGKFVDEAKANAWNKAKRAFNKLLNPAS